MVRCAIRYAAACCSFSTATETSNCRPYGAGRCAITRRTGSGPNRCCRITGRCAGHCRCCGRGSKFSRCSVRRRGLVQQLVEQYHYLQYDQPVGEQVKYLVTASGQAIACLAFSSAPRHLAPRDRFIGWDAEARRRNIRLIAYSTRFLILPWVAVPHLASHLLGRVAATIACDWERMYAHPVWLLETFVDPARFRGTCYRAANWIPLGSTTGRGKDDLTHSRTGHRREFSSIRFTAGFAIC